MLAPAARPPSTLPGWPWLTGLGLLLALAGGAAPARAESLRCVRGIAAEGDSKLSLMAKCGQPVLTDTYCAPIYQNPHYYPVPEPYASRILPCQVTEEWLYDRGPGNLFATVRLRSGVVLSITYGHTPR